MFPLNSEPSFHFELLRMLAHAVYEGADIGEVLEASTKIVPGDMESFYSAFNTLALRVKAQADAIDAKKHPVSARQAYFKASNYFRCADFYLHGNWDDPRINSLWDLQTVTFDKAIALLPIPGERIELEAAEGSFKIPAIYYRAQLATPATPKRALILHSGFDGAQEEMLHMCGFAALERGYSIITCEGPGQCTVRREQGLGFITEWEKVVSPAFDYLATRPEVDAKHIGLVGYSMGGFLCLRAAAFEHRLAAVIAVDGVWNVYEAFRGMMPPQLVEAYEAGRREEVDKAMLDIIKSGKAPAGLRWGVEHGMWSFNEKTPSEFIDRTRGMTLEGIVNQIDCPAWVGCAADDMFFQGQPEKVRDAMGDRATYVELGVEDAAGHHCHVGAAVLLHQKFYDWFDDVVASK